MCRRELTLMKDAPRSVQHNASLMIRSHAIESDCRKNNLQQTSENCWLAAACIALRRTPVLLKMLKAEDVSFIQSTIRDFRRKQGKCPSLPQELSVCMDFLVNWRTRITPHNMSTRGQVRFSKEENLPCPRNISKFASNRSVVSSNQNGFPSPLIAHLLERAKTPFAYGFLSRNPVLGAADKPYQDQSRFVVWDVSRTGSRDFIQGMSTVPVIVLEDEHMMLHQNHLLSSFFADARLGLEYEQRLFKHFVDYQTTYPAKYQLRKSHRFVFALITLEPLKMGLNLDTWLLYSRVLTGASA